MIGSGEKLRSRRRGETIKGLNGCGFEGGGGGGDGGGGESRLLSSA